MLQRRTAGNNQPGNLAPRPPHALPVSDLFVPPRLRPAAQPDTPAPPATFQPIHPRRPHRWLPQTQAPLKATSNFPDAVVASAQTARLQGTPQPPPGLGTANPTPLPSEGPPTPLPATQTPERPPPRRARAYLAGSLRRPRPLRVRPPQSRPFARSEPPSGPPTGPAPALQPRIRWVLTRAPPPRRALGSPTPFWGQPQKEAHICSALHTVQNAFSLSRLARSQRREVGEVGCITPILQRREARLIRVIYPLPLSYNK